MALFNFFNNKIKDKIEFAFLRYIGNNLPVFADQHFHGNAKTYASNADVYSIINLIAKNCVNVDIELFEIKGSKQTLISEHEIIDLLYKPNNDQSYGDFIEQYIGNKLITGNGYIYGVKPIIGINKTVAKELKILPSNYIQILANRDGVIGYKFDTWYETQINFIPEEVLHVKNFNVKYDAGQYLYGLSPLSVAYLLTSSSESGDIARVKAFQNMGAMGVISSNSNDAMTLMSPDEANQLHEKYIEKFGGVKNFNKVLFTTANVKWQNMGMSPVDLQILASKAHDLRSLCNVFGIQSQLLNDPENKTYHNQEQAVKSMYEMTVIPEMKKFVDGLNRWLIPQYSARDNKNYWLNISTKNVNALKVDLSALITSLKDASWLTINEKRELSGFGSMQDAMYDEINQAQPQPDIIPEPPKQ